MKFNKKNIISSLVLIGAVAISSVSVFAVKSNADEETLAQVKQELQEQIDDKNVETIEKDNEIEELNKKVSSQEETIEKLNNNISALNNAINNTNQSVKSTQQDLNTTKQVQKEDKKEVVNHSDAGDAKLQNQIDDIKTSNDGFDRSRKDMKPDHLPEPNENSSDDGKKTFEPIRK